MSYIWIWFLADQINGGLNRFTWESFASQTGEQRNSLFGRSSRRCRSWGIERFSRVASRGFRNCGRNDEDAPSQGASFNRLSTLQRVARSPVSRARRTLNDALCSYARYKLSHRLNRTRKFKSPCWVANLLVISGNRTCPSF